jgi:vacuolar-type H+-ATPase subunit F/Vma7
MVAIGPDQFTLLFGAIGFEPAEADVTDFVDVLRRVLADRSVALVVCGESFAIHAHERFQELYAESRAAILVVPDRPEVHGLGREAVRAEVEKAAGVDLLSSLEGRERTVPDLEA